MSGRLAAESGQASIEVVAGFALLLLCALVALQLLAVGYCSTLVDGAAEAGAIALVKGEPVGGAVAAALPGWARDRFAVRRRGDALTVEIRPPALFDSIAPRLEVSSSAAARPAS